MIGDSMSFRKEGGGFECRSTLCLRSMRKCAVYVYRHIEAYAVLTRLGRRLTTYIKLKKEFSPCKQKK